MAYLRFSNEIDGKIYEWIVFRYSVLGNNCKMNWRRRLNIFFSFEARITLVARKTFNLTPYYFFCVECVRISMQSTLRCRPGSELFVVLYSTQFFFIFFILKIRMNIILRSRRKKIPRHSVGRTVRTNAVYSTERLAMCRDGKNESFVRIGSFERLQFNWTTDFISSAGGSFVCRVSRYLRVNLQW